MRADELAFLRAGPADTTSAAEDAALNARYREVFVALADQLDPEVAWSIASSAIERVGDGDAGARTRFEVRRAALVRWAAVVGEEALPEALGAIAEDAETGLAALEAIAAHADTDRARVLAQVRPYFAHSALARIPSHAAVAFRALAPDARPEDLRLSKAIAAAWGDAAITESSIVAELRDQGLVITAIAPRDGRRRLGRALVLDVLERAHVLASFDAESGFAPVPYATLLEESFAPLVRELSSIEVRVEATALPDGSTFAYAIHLRANEIEVDTRFEDASDYYDVARILRLFDALLERAGARSRFHSLATGDQSAIVMCAPPKQARAIAKKFRLRILKAS